MMAVARALAFLFIFKVVCLGALAIITGFTLGVWIRRRFFRR